MREPCVYLNESASWDQEGDIVVVGSGASGLVAALMAAEGGANVLVLEKGADPGGTTAKSSGGVWVPNNHHMRRLGIEDRRDVSVRYMARTARPHLYSADLPNLGLPPWEFELLEVFFDKAAEAFASLESIDALRTIPLADLPDYYPEIREDESKSGRSLCPRLRSGDPGEGPDMIQQLSEALDRRRGRLLLEHRVVSAVINHKGWVVGVVAQTPQARLMIGASSAVIFASGGFAHNSELCNSYLPGPVLGSCAANTNEGDFIPIAQSLGAAMRNMNQAWNAPILLELALIRDPTLKSTFNIVGDSVLVVNRYGRRVMNEKAVYHDAVAPMLAWDGARCEYPNLLMFPIWDQRSMDKFRGSPFDGGMMPALGADSSHVLRGETLGQLSVRLDERLEALSQATGGVRLADNFRGQLSATVQRFNDYAHAGRDFDFHRGESLIEQHLYKLATNAVLMGSVSPSAASAGPTGAGAGGRETDSEQASLTMFPLSDEGPYYASILAPGTLDTKGGPMTNRHGQVLDHGGNPIPGLYAVGNCAASPTSHGYWGAGATLGPMITFAWLAGQHAASQPGVHG